MLLMMKMKHRISFMFHPNTMDDLILNLTESKNQIAVYPFKSGFLAAILPQRGFPIKLPLYKMPDAEPDPCWTPSGLSKNKL